MRTIRLSSCIGPTNTERNRHFYVVLDINVILVTGWKLLLLDLKKKNRNSFKSLYRYTAKILIVTCLFVFMPCFISAHFRSNVSH